MIVREEMTSDAGHGWLKGALGLNEEQNPFPWQLALLERFQKGELPHASAIDIPTGLGKTGVMAIWLVARALGAPLPRRLVYVVDRRAVVDQATRVAEELREFVEATPTIKKELGLDGRALPVSTSRGQFIDNKEWLDDPASPAIVVGTVDMVGSRLLFEGYGVSRKMRPFHAGLLGSDTLLVLDEAHLIPPFLKLVEAVAANPSDFGPRDEKYGKIVPPLRLISMSATGARPGSGDYLRLGEDDLKHAELGRRLQATKLLTIKELGDAKKLDEALANEAWKFAEKGNGLRITIYCDSRKDAESIATDLRKRVKANKGQATDVELLVGARRVMERQRVAQWLADHGFSKGHDGNEWVKPERPAFLVATSAGEVGVDLDADRMVCDLVAWERMIQRLGRVNRFGNGEAKVTVISDLTPPKEKSDDAEAEWERKKNVSVLLKRLPELGGGRDASTAAIRDLKLKADPDQELQELVESATTPAPLRPALTRPLVDAWSMTSLEEHTGRPEIQPWLRGWVDEKPETRIVWRKFLPVHTSAEEVLAPLKRNVNEFFESAPPRLSEVLETETWQVVDWLAKRAKILRPAEKETYGFIEEGVTGPLSDDDVVALVLTPANELRAVLRLPDLHSRRRLEVLKNEELVGMTLVVDARFAGLSEDGLLEHTERDAPRTIDDGSSWSEPVPYRVREVTADEDATETEWMEVPRIALGADEGGVTNRWLVVEALRESATTEDARGAGKLQLLDEHGDWTEKRARRLAERIGLPAEYTEALAAAARFHDTGKAAARWQRAFGAPNDGRKYAKTITKRIDQSTLDGYRHELGSLLNAEKSERIQRLPPDLRDLALHLIVSHHGFARPIIPTRGVEGAPPSALQEKEREIALRDARLQKQWGPWGLAWWESLLRAADHQASADNNARKEVQ